MLLRHGSTYQHNPCYRANPFAWSEIIFNFAHLWLRYGPAYANNLIGSAWNATPKDNSFHTYTNENGYWYNTSTSFFPEINAWLDKNAIAAAGNIGYGMSFDGDFLDGDPPGGGDKKESVINGLGGLNSVLNFAAQGNIIGLYRTTGLISPLFGLYGIRIAWLDLQTTDKSYGDYGKFSIQAIGNGLISVPDGSCVVAGYAIIIMDANDTFRPFYEYLDKIGVSGAYIPIGNGLLFIPPQKQQ